MRKCGYGGIGRRAGFRYQWASRAGSSPVIRTKKVRSLEGSELFLRNREQDLNHSSSVIRTKKVRSLEGSELFFEEPGTGLEPFKLRYPHQKSLEP